MKRVTATFNPKWDVSFMHSCVFPNCSNINSLTKVKLRKTIAGSDEPGVWDLFPAHKNTSSFLLAIEVLMVYFQ